MTFFSRTRPHLHDCSIFLWVCLFLLRENSTNLGEVRNRGFEITLSSVNIDHENFKWSSSLVASLNRNVRQAHSMSHRRHFSNIVSIRQLLKDNYEEIFVLWTWQYHSYFHLVQLWRLFRWARIILHISSSAFYIQYHNLSSLS